MVYALCLPERYIFSFLAFLGNFINLSGRNCLNLAIVSIQEENKASCNSTNSTENGSGCEAELEWDDASVSKVLGAFFWGICFSEVLGGPFVDVIGGRRCLLFSNILSGAMTLLVPLTASYSVTALVLTQVFTGVSCGLVVPSCHSLIARWEPTSDKGKLSTVIYTASPMSSVVCVAVTGLLSSYLHWSLPFYIFGCLTFLWAVCWLFLVHDDPFTNPRVSARELELYKDRVLHTDTIKFRHIPWRKILTSVPLWAAVISNAAFVLIFSFTASELPQLLDQVFALEISRSGLISSLPFVFNYIWSYVTSAAFTFLLNREMVSLSGGRKLCTSLSLVGSGVCLAVLPWLGGNLTTLTILITLGYALAGSQICGSWSSPIDLCPNFAATAMGLSGLVSYLMTSFLPLSYSYLITDSSNIRGWSPALMTTAAIMVAAALVFALLGSAEVQSWNHIQKEGEEEKWKVEMERRKSSIKSVRMESGQIETIFKG